MTKEYEELRLRPGSTIDHAVSELLNSREQGKLATFKFNGVMLQSDTVTLDSAYQEITGKTKTEFDASLR